MNHSIPGLAVRAALVILLAGALPVPSAWAQEKPAPAAKTQEVPPAAAPVPPPAPPPPEPVVLTPLEFVPALPTTPVAWVDETPVPASTLLELVLEQNFSTGVSALMMGKIAEIELKAAGQEITEKDLREELTDMIASFAPGKTLEEVEKSGQTSMKHLMAQARNTRAWKKLFWTAQKVPDDQRTNQTQQLMLQFFMRQKMEPYDRRIRGQNPAPTIPGIVAQIVNKETKNEIVIGASEALDFLIGLVKPSGLIEARNEVVERAVLAAALAKAKAAVTEEEVANWAAKMRAKHPPPFTWDQICRIKGTSMEREMERWRRIQAWKRISGQQPAEAEIETFLNEHKHFFLGKTKKISHILVRTTDEVTGLTLGSEKEKEAEETIKVIRDKLVEGVDFGWLAENYSDDTVTAKGKGRLGQPIKEWGGGLDPRFQTAAWKLENIGDLSEPVRSQFGWHVIKLEEVTNPQAKQEPNWKEERYWEWIQDEFESQKMNAWLSELKAEAKVRLAPDAVVFALKDREYAPK